MLKCVYCELKWNSAMQTLVIPTDAPSVTGPPQGQWTAADWDTLPDDGNRYEIIEGYLYMTTAPSFFHQWIIQRCVRHIGIPAEDQELAYFVIAPIGVFMPGCDPVQPDFLLVLKANEHIIHDRRIYGVPDLIVEVLSPTSVDYDEGVKFQAYANAGVPEYVVINPANPTLTHYRLAEPGRYDKIGTYGESETVTIACLPSISLHVANLFAGAPDTTL
jgi:Uma2 family endonuclease